MRHGVFSLVVDRTDASVKKLPSVYIDRAQVFADKDLEKVQRRLAQLVHALSKAKQRPTYLLQPCEFDGRKGLYGRDLFNRSTFRLKLARKGLIFNDDPYVWLSNGSIRSEQWEEFRPSFLIMGPHDDDPEKVLRSSAAMLAFNFGVFRFGDMFAAELSSLAKLLQGASALSAGNPDRIIEALGRGD